MGIFQSIGHFFKHAAVWVSDQFVKLFGSDAANTFAVAAESLLHSAIGQIAWDAVNEAEKLAAGTDKLGAAFAQIISTAATQGIAVKDSVVNMLIEVAVQKLKGSFGPQPPVPATPTTPLSVAS
jgi:hypothetical protein